MNSLAFIFIPDIVAIIPGVIALLLFLLFTYLYEQGRQPYFRAWQIGWGAYCLHYALDAWTFYHQPSAAVFLLGSLLLLVMAMCILVSTRLMRYSRDRQRFESCRLLSLPPARPSKGGRLRLRSASTRAGQSRRQAPLR